MTRLEHYTKAIKKAKDLDEAKGALIVLLIDYSHNLISRMDNNSKLIKEWLEDKTE